MAETKPTNAVDWVATGAITEPLSGVKTSGYASGNKLPAKYMNWFWELVTQWFTWFDERFFDGATNADFTIKCPTTEAGDLKLEGGSSAAGTDQDGGDAELSGGSTTGTGGTTVTLKAATAAASGSGVNTPEAYLTVDGDNAQNKFAKPLASNISSVAGAAGVDALTAEGQEVTSGVFTAGDGAVITGGDSAAGAGGRGVVATGGDSINAGSGVEATGGEGGGSTFGYGIKATGGAGGTAAAAGSPGAVVSGGAGGSGGAGNFDGGTGASIGGGAGSGTGLRGTGASISGHDGVKANATENGGKCLICDRGGSDRVDIHLTPRSGAPSSPVEGDIWYDSSQSAGQRLRIYYGGAVHYINTT
jgi:hypothetical protein